MKKTTVAILGNPKTTTGAIAGLVILLTSILRDILDGNAATSVEWAVVIPPLLACFGLLFARDGDKSSEDIGLK
jgi:uncharacterized membrane protein